MAKTWMSSEQDADARGTNERPPWRKNMGFELGKDPNSPPTTDDHCELLVEPPAPSDKLSDARPDLCEETQRVMAVVPGGAEEKRDLADYLFGELQATRRDRRRAWSVVAALVLAGGIGVWWAARTVTLAHTESAALTNRLIAVQERLADVSADRARQADKIEALQTERAHLLSELGQSESRVVRYIAELQAERAKAVAARDPSARAPSDKPRSAGANR